ncbi:SDR family NAD(P)-dependent oxidoreductase [Bacteroidetes bacterium endosymbiont of Geopemphigus sp.]|uniref:SDR family NAD(P)-dependent oxidoreductase n=1 Tax=Bacteroidetes bacterium endosymbiont of Geopemphigus sp. TaxID=2047937 RepID=UPI000CD114F5|nr:SDR family oxidoreductase [Bacteroidetes bacterium endosymbiont of Geopemphigus sp.]
MSKRVIITGAGRGIGYALFKNFLDNRHEVLGISRDIHHLSLLSDIPQKHILSLDLTKISSYERILEAIPHWDRVDILINNAGYLIRKPFKNLSDGDFEYSFSLNTLAPIRMIRILTPLMSRSSHIVNISTIGAVQGSKKFPGLAAYTTSKAALCNLTELLSEEFKSDGPIINCLALGSVQTEMLAQAFPNYKASLIPEEIADYIYRFSLEGQKFYNGKVLSVSIATP